MKIGYPCINRTLPCTSCKTFRLASYSDDKLKQTIESNLNCLQDILEFNVENNLLFFRISSDIIPFASHPICTFPWQKEFKNRFKELGYYIKKHHMRISMHPDQFVLINALSEKIVQNSIAELTYHAEVLNLMELDNTAKLQIHVGGVYGDKEASIQRFITQHELLPTTIKNRLVIENDDRLYSVQDCLRISNATGIPILFDSFHHSLLNNGESMREALSLVEKTWKERDGIPMIDYSSQASDSRVGKHSESIEVEDFKQFLNSIKGIDIDIMLEIKDKEASALQAVQYLR